ncbi:MAG TPA: hypothetical protein VF950_28220 [Planctomycetota bacterium]
MNDLSRRHALLAAAAAAVTTGASTPAQAASDAPDLRAAREAALRFAVDRLDSPVLRARVFLCRSWDRQAFFYVDERTRGFAALSPEAFALAAAAQAADRPLAFQYRGYAPEHAGAGRFDEVRLALDPRDLPGQPLL